MKTATNKKKMMIGSLAVLTATLICIVIILWHETGNGYEIYESWYTLESGFTFKNIQVRHMRDKELEKKVNESLNSYFYILIEPWFEQGKVRALEPIIHYQSERYLSIEYIFAYEPAINKYWRQCITVDMQTGEVVFFDDLIDLNEDFAELVKTGSISKCDLESVWVTTEEGTKMINDYFSKKDTTHILRIFSEFTRSKLYGDYNENNKPQDDIFVDSLYYDYYCIEEGKIRFTSPNSTHGLYNDDTTYIETKDIEEYLKVPAW